MRRHITTAVIVCVMAQPMASQPQQTDSLLWRDLTFVLAQDPWLTDHNAAGLTHASGPSLSTATITTQWSRGGLVDFNQSKRSRQGTATVSSLYRLSKRAVVYGTMRYDSETGHDMAGSVFLGRVHQPFDIVEDSLTNTGKKHSDTYQLVGAVGVDIYRGLSIGACIDYTAANYAKYKDLRHKNSLMDMKVTAGVQGPIGRWGTAGGHFYYGRDTESLQFSTYGKTDKTYMSLIDYGAMMGEVEQYGTDRFTDPSREMPFVDESLGGGAEVEWGSIEGLRWYHSANLTRRKGYYGRKSPYTTQLTHHKGKAIEYHTRLAYCHGTTRHAIDFRWNAEKLTNYEENYRELKNEAGSNYFEYYDAVKSADKLWWEALATYTLHLGVKEQMATTTLQGVLHLWHRKQTAYDYPYLRRQDIGYNDVWVAATHHLPLCEGLLTLNIKAGFQKGNGEPFEDNTMATPSDKQTPPPTMDTYLHREHECYTLPQYHVGGKVRYAHALKHTGVTLFAEANAEHRKANGSHDFLTGRDRTYVGMSIGCNF